MKLSVNLNKVALLRNARGTGNPDVAMAARTVLEAGAHGLTLHWREDERHATAEDVRVCNQVARDFGVEFNLEGDLREDIVNLAIELGVTQLTLVPVKPGEVTSNHGWALPEETERLRTAIRRAKSVGVRTSIFVEPSPAVLPFLQATEADRVEIYTLPWAEAFGTPEQDNVLGAISALVAGCDELGIGVNAGHDLDLKNMPLLAREVPNIAEVSIGHAITCDALYIGLKETIRRYLCAIRGEEVEAPTTWDRY
ncbi:MAG: pyridoxine 5'-phosphate synthase [Myxococcales bacterium]|nr:pyridoxine 5'-phosphate synthase [Myxococcales bacterium]